MNEIDSILNAAMLGSSGRRVGPGDFPADLRPDIEAMMQGSHDYEDVFLRATSMLFAYLNSGKTAASAGIRILLPECAPETYPYISDSNVSLAIYLNDNGLPHLFRYALWYFAQKRQILPPYILPRFVELAYTSGGKYMHQYRFAVWPLLGNRGKWLVDAMDLGGEKFADSPHQLRLRMFVAMRKAGFSGSSHQLEAIWPGITARQRNDFLSVFMRVWPGDLDFLWKAFSGGGPGADAALSLMCRSSESRPVEYFMKVLDRSLRIDGRRHCDFQPIEDTETLERYGIDSSISESDGLPEFLKKLPPCEVLIFKLIQHVPLKFWMTKMDCTAADAARFLDTNPAFRMGFDFKAVICNFQDSVWALEYCRLKGKFFAEFLPFMDARMLDSMADCCDMDAGFRISEKICGVVENYEPWLGGFSMAVVRHIIRTRNFDNTPATAQYLAVRLSRDCDIAMQSYMADNYGNDMVATFFARVLKYRGIIRNIIQ